MHGQQDDSGTAAQQTSATAGRGRTAEGAGSSLSPHVSSRPRTSDPVPGWQHRLRMAAILSDIVIVCMVTALTVVLGWNGSDAANRAHLMSGLVGATLLVTALSLARAWDSRMLGAGPVEFKRIGNATLGATVALSLGGLTFLVASVRIWVLVVIPLTGLALASGRYAIRKRLHRMRAMGDCTLPVLAIGGNEAVCDLIRRTRRDLHFGWRVDAICTPTGQGPDGAGQLAGVPVIGDLDAVGDAAGSGRYRVVAVCRAPGWGPGRLQQLAWELEGTDTELAVDPGLMEIAGPRMHIIPVDGLPLLRLSEPRFTGFTRALKGAMDRVLAGALILAALPVFVAIAVAIVLDDRGPVFFRQVRVGANASTFRILKFRSMIVNAEAHRAALASDNEVDGPLFKMARDPRVTRVGAVLRRYSLDELPQLFNVLAGSMALVGPRPPLPSEVAAYADHARRRLLVRPGITGLWQVSGRSDLTWEESVRLDLRYVENWSIALDLTILWKTIGAVLSSRGAY